MHVQDTQHVVELGVGRIQFGTLPVDALPERFGNVFANMGIDQLGHNFVDAFVDLLLDFGVIAMGYVHAFPIATRVTHALSQDVPRPLRRGRTSKCLQNNFSVTSWTTPSCLLFILSSSSACTTAIDSNSLLILTERPFQTCLRATCCGNMLTD